MKWIIFEACSRMIEWQLIGSLNSVWICIYFQLNDKLNLVRFSKNISAFFKSFSLFFSLSFSFIFCFSLFAFRFSNLLFFFGCFSLVCHPFIKWISIPFYNKNIQIRKKRFALSILLCNYHRVPSTKISVYFAVVFCISSSGYSICFQLDDSSLLRFLC